MIRRARLLTGILDSLAKVVALHGADGMLDGNARERQSNLSVQLDDAAKHVIHSSTVVKDKNVALTWQHLLRIEQSFNAFYASLQARDYWVSSKNGQQLPADSISPASGAVKGATTGDGETKSAVGGGRLDHQKHHSNSKIGRARSFIRRATSKTQGAASKLAWYIFREMDAGKETPNPTLAMTQLCMQYWALVIRKGPSKVYLEADARNMARAEVVHYLQSRNREEGEEEEEDECKGASGGERRVERDRSLTDVAATKITAQKPGSISVPLTPTERRGKVLRFASPELRADKEIVLTAVRNDGEALAFASADLRNHREVVLAAIGGGLAPTSETAVGGGGGAAGNSGGGVQVQMVENGRDFTQRLKLTSRREWQEWSKSGQRPSNVPSSPDQVYKGKGWVSWPDWMGYKPKHVVGNLLSFIAARDIVRKLKLTSKEEWKEWSKSGQRPSNVPSHPDQVYKGKGWVSWPDWMGYNPPAGHTKGQMLSFISARDIVRKLKMTSLKEWKEWSKSGQRPSNVPGHPDEVYKGKGWVSYPDWMGYSPKHVEGQMISFIAARDIVRKLELKSQKEWREWSKSGQRPSNVPSLPSEVYKGKGWVSYPDWMGYLALDPNPIIPDK
eukprot:g6158.t1